MNILVTGGAGYIGSITVRALQKVGHSVVVFDNLEYGHENAVSTTLVTGNLLNKQDLRKLDSHSFDGVIHFAGYIQVGESMSNPGKYFENNIMSGVNLLDYMVEKKVPSIIFSSTAAIFGNPESTPIKEDDKNDPTSVYGESKLAFERILKWYDNIFGIKSIALRYFNAAGASLDGSLGENHIPETHIIPIAINAVLEKKIFYLFGSDYPTEDGTCIRDYIHVEDLASAHVLALQYVTQQQQSSNFNLGVGRGYSNKEVVSMVKQVTGVDFHVEYKERRPGDPPVLLADNTKAQEVLGFQPQHSDLETIVKTAWEWHKKGRV